MSYSLQDGNNREWGIGTVAAGNVLNRTTITGTLVAGTYTTGGAALTLSGGTSLLECVEHEGSALDTIDNADALRLKVSDVYPDFVASGLVTGTSVSLSGVMTPGVAYVVGTRVEKLIADATLTFTYAVSSDTYNDISNAGVITHVAVANNAAAPAVTANSIRLEKVVTSGTAITSVVRLAAGRSLPVALKDPVTGATALLAGGAAISTIGSTITVGSGGQFSTIQAAINYAQTKPVWTLKQAAAFTCSAWAQNSSTLTVNQLPPVSMMADEWFLLAGDTHYYQLDGSSGTTTILSSMRRIETAVSGTPAANTYKANVYRILLLDDHYEELVTINGDCHLQFDGNGRTVWHGGVSNNGMNNGSVSFDLMNIENSGPFMGDNTLGTAGIGNGWSFENAVSLHLGGTLTINALSQDFFSPYCYIGKVTSKHTKFIHHCHVPLAHMNNFHARGDIVFESPVHTVKVENTVVSDCRFIDFPTCRRLVVSGLSSTINDPLGVLSNYYVVANTQYALDVDVSGTTISSNGTGATNFQVIDIETGTAPTFSVKFNIGAVLISAPYTTGYKKSVNISGVPSSWIAQVNLQDCPYPKDTNAAVAYARWGISETLGLTVGASPYSYTAPAPGVVVISGGTVSAVTRRGINVGVTGGQVLVQTGDVVTTTYSAVPTMTFLPT
jgi:hypothetical protein